jgi:SAM-dependent methyltransferase
MKQSLLRLKEDFAYQTDKGIYMPHEGEVGDQQFAYNDGDIAENYVLECIRQANDVSDNSGELASYARDWSSYYHLAPGRANHIRVLDLPENISVLELGAGCGAISRYLGENHRELHCIEGSPRRAMIAKERCRGLNNVKVYCSDFRKLQLEPVYDVVLLNGVLEYAPVFFHAQGRSPDEAADALLKLAKSALAENGILIIAIENKIGLKYWCGACEDHTGGLFDGIHGYPTPGTARTYSKSELAKVLTNSGFGFSKFYSCFPDYKFAKSILTDNGHSSNDYFIHNWLPYPAENPGLSRKYLIHEGLATRTLSNAGLIHEFANSFLVVASRNMPIGFDRSIKPEWLASKVSVANRDRSVHCITKFYPKTATVEKCLVEYPHTAGIKDGKPLGHILEPASWISGNLLSWEAADAVMSKNFSTAIHTLVGEYHDVLLTKFTVGEKDDEGFPLLKGECFDFIMGNIIRAQTGLESIDTEWIPDRRLAADYVLFRSLSYDVLGLNKHWLSRKIGDGDEFIITTIRKLYPNYNRKRHLKNRSLENSILLQIRGSLGGAEEFSAHHRTVAWKRSIKAFARQLPAGIKTKIIQTSEAFSENIRVLFADT